MATNYINDFYRQFEELNKKLDKLIKENKEQSLTIYSLNLETKALKKIIEEKDKKIELLLEEIERLKNKNSKDSSNSSKPSSTNITTPKKKSGANLYNYRIKTNRPIGAQLGHKGSTLNKRKIENLIENNDIEVRTITHIIKGKGKDIIKYRVGIETKAYVEKHIFKHNIDSKEAIPIEFYTDVTYDNSIKALSVELGVHNVVSYKRQADFFNIITDGILNISSGTLFNFLKEFSKKSELTINNLTKEILDSKTIYTDETSCKFNKKNMFVRNYSNETMAIYKGHKNKGHAPIIEDNILTNFCGGIMGDHDTTLQKYGAKNYECNIHVGRYLEELIQNIPDILWPQEMKKLLFRIENTRKIAKSFGMKSFEEEKTKEYSNEFDKILDLAKEENKLVSSKYYKDKANKLYRRLSKYKKNHLYFVKSFDIPFDNNLSESDLRVLKIKTKVSGGFRSKEGVDAFLNALTITKTSIKKQINPFESVKKIFNNETLFVN